MGFFDKMGEAALAFNQANNRANVDRHLLELGDKAYALFKADRLDAEKLCKLAKDDTDLLNDFIKCRADEMPGNYEEQKVMRSLAKDALVIAIENSI